MIRLLAFLLFASTIAHSQELLVNGSFETENICTEYSKNCAPEGWIASSLMSNYYFDVRFYSYWGEHFVGLIAANQHAPAKRSFLRTRLLCGLRKGSNYTLSFYMRSKHPVIDSLGIYFSPGDFLFDKRPFSQIKPSMLLRDSTNTENDSWQKLTFNYQATGDENYLTIGSFRKKDIRFSRPAEIEGNYYYYIDSVSLTPNDPHELLCSSIDSMRTEIFAENERHNLLERKVAYYKKSPPVVVPAPVTELELVDTLIIPDILFATASAKLNPASALLLDSVAQAILRRPIDSLVVEGHTDSVGTLQYNNELSLDRARSVSQYIALKSFLDEEKLVTRYFAFTRPVASNQQESGRQRNRRVEIFVYRREKTRR